MTTKSSERSLEWVVFFKKNEDKKRCRMTEDERCILCGGGEVDVEHFLVRCNEF